jgi:hypothetical protein
LKNPIHIDRIKHDHARPIDPEVKSETVEITNDQNSAVAIKTNTLSNSTSTTDVSEAQPSADLADDDQNKSFRVDNDVYEVERLVGVKGSGANRQYS